ncbi:MAG: hypothetical protein EA344_00335 [Alkalicoccus sp.]|nr:MAG: hypothetical protein EA344_00335 [Alkalicoccus sp.]
MEIFTAAAVSAALIIVGILVANVKILTAKEMNDSSEAEKNKTKKIIAVCFVLLLLILAAGYFVT